MYGSGERWKEGGGKEGETAGRCVWSCRSGLIGTFCSWGILICCRFDAVGCSAVVTVVAVELVVVMVVVVMVVVVVVVVVVVIVVEELSNGRKGRKPEIANNSKSLCDEAYNGFLHSYARLKLVMQLDEQEKSRNHEKSPVPSVRCVKGKIAHTTPPFEEGAALSASTIILPAGPPTRSSLWQPSHATAYRGLTQHWLNLPIRATSQTLLPSLCAAAAAAAAAVADVPLCGFSASGRWLGVGLLNGGWMAVGGTVTRHPSSPCGAMMPVTLQKQHCPCLLVEGCVPSISANDDRPLLPGLLSAPRWRV